MVCVACRAVGAELRGGFIGDGASVRRLLCDRCGTVLDAGEQDNLMLHRLSQLARFGLASGSAPILVAVAADAS